MKLGIDLIAQERGDHLSKHGRSITHDVRYNTKEQLRDGATKLLANSASVQDQPPPYGWDEDIWKKMVNKSYKERLIIAGSLIAAELDRTIRTEKDDDGRD